MNWKCFKLGVWIILLSIGWSVSYSNCGMWFSTKDAIDLHSFIDELMLAPSQDIEISLLPHYRETRNAPAH